MLASRGFQTYIFHQFFIVKGVQQDLFYDSSLSFPQPHTTEKIYKEKVVTNSTLTRPVNQLRV